MIRLSHKKSSANNRLGQKISSSVGRIGHKVIGSSEDIGARAGLVESAANKVSQVAGGAATVAAMTGMGVPVAGALGSLSAGSVGVGRAAGMTKTAADKVTQGKRAMAAVDRVFR